MTGRRLLKRVPLFSSFTEEEIDQMFEVARERGYPKNSVILFEDDPGDALYVVVGGQVKVVLIGKDGKEVILSVLKDGDFFGEMALIDDEPRSAHVIAMEDTDLLVLRREDFQRCLDGQPRMALSLLRALSGRLRKADEKIGDLALLDVGGRIARLLLQLAEEGNGETISRSVTHSTIAQMIGSSRETVSRTFRNLADNGLIEVSQQAIVIRDREGLKRTAGLR